MLGMLGVEQFTTVFTHTDNKAVSDDVRKVHNAKTLFILQYLQNSPGYCLILYPREF